ncbi:DAK2 domain-containing protein [Pelotomaculum terephthalicicum JT]|uniref:DAK2 domain-containing protein n=1 Tax=Pelotomaculum TaxID=191373 RepID=UPI0009CAA056|nr:MULTISPECIES: DAK2 domain-containing protein [Pelotomaculum]MCG9969551.1 DAK2 domain-containing protein [Pelotomaculum terephthalicicum JT]OPX86136.1 MAG: DAK2 domain protein [Pelotomaculum sp. PtaB.Bin117]OPY59963.1 MAG: DAK2 domain protein [Pelotomaculum sp. PtaU1.Bin065]
MAIYSFNGVDLKMMLRGAVKLLGQSREEIDALNVFPVPDGDTGTNMYQTLVSAVKEAESVDSNHIGLVAGAAARGGLIGARGNSGVILSQIMQGFANSLSGVERATAPDIASALEEGAKVAYRTVMSPVEGTILTVVRKSAEGAAARQSSDLLRLMVTVFKKALDALQETPNLLPVLKRSGVVDAGGRGFVVILEGFLRALKSASPAAKTSCAAPLVFEEEPPSKNQPVFQENAGAINFTYCTELLVKGANLPLEKMRAALSPFGDSLMVVGGESVAKVHIHSNNPGLILEYCLKHGTLHDLKINNMAEQNQELLAETERSASGKPFGIISVGAGEGITEIMKNLGADAVVSGGQTLNPSTGGILAAIDEVPARRVIILPNNKNIILTAEQAGRLSQKEVTVIPSKSIPQGLAALLTLNPEDNFAAAARKMTKALGSVRSGEITTAVRDTEYRNLHIKKGDIIGLADGDLSSAGTELTGVLEDLLQVLIEGEGRLVTIYFGDKITVADAEEITERMRQKYAGQDFEMQNGGQPVYDLLISVE